MMESFGRNNSSDRELEIYVLNLNAKDHGPIRTLKRYDDLSLQDTTAGQDCHVQVPVDCAVYIVIVATPWYVLLATCILNITELSSVHGIVQVNLASFEYLDYCNSEGSHITSIYNPSLCDYAKFLR